VNQASREADEFLTLGPIDGGVVVDRWAWLAHKAAVEASMTQEPTSPRVGNPPASH
jgi:hypothetical protein